MADGARSPHGAGHRSGSRYLLITSIGALGVVYGDIGTSPLYALRETFNAGSLEVTRSNVLGVLSFIFWSLIVVVTIKYLVFVLRADNDGEGGILALTALVGGVRTRRQRTKAGLILVGLFGTALLYGDGMITPAISVLSAVEGAEVAAPGVERFVVPAAVIILALLFSIQHRGTARIGAIFGPVMFVWFAVLALLGIGYIAADPGVLAAVDPRHAIELAMEHPAGTFLGLGAIFLVVTGSEALYADMGHFGRRPIRLTWLLVGPALVINYFGQGAMLIADPATIDNPFYRMPPEWAVVPLVVLATMATVIASQALITGAYSLTMQAVQLGYLPRVVIDHTSPREFGQVYIASVNWGLMAACIALVIAFGSSSALASAYGVAVTATMVVTTVLLNVVMRHHWGWSTARATAATVVFLAVDTAFFASNLLKIPSGGWFPLVVGLVIIVIMTTWKRGRQLLSERMHRGDLPIERFVASITGHPQQRVPGTAVYMFPEPGLTPPALIANLRHNGVLHENVVLVTVNVHRVPRITQARRHTVHHLGEGFHQVVLHYGFVDRTDVPKALGSIVRRNFGVDAGTVTYFIGAETVVPTRHPGMSLWREHLYSVMHRNASTPATYFELPSDRVVAIGVNVEI